MSNRLQYESSPYLLQHAENPVDWYPWGEEAFQRAKQEDKPVFLSIGYSTCHWCHVMAHESFEDSETAALLNQYFICIKVDKEERPDIDSIYMSVCQALTGSGGWPTSIFMTPGQKPFFAGTYFPKHSQGRMIGLQELAHILHDKWENDRAMLLYQADEMTAQLRQHDKAAHRTAAGLTNAALTLYKQSYDRVNGGFCRAPKFPAPHNLLFLLTYYERRSDGDCLSMAEHTLTQMYRGGLFDHIGYGFCRYSTDARFLVPHFEKMLYDNALLILTYAKAYAVTRKPLYLDIAKQTATYVLRELTDPSGGFYCAQDADSDGEEGKFYLFTPDEIHNILGAEDGAAFNRQFDVTAAGNFEGKSIPNLLHSDPSDRFFDASIAKIYAYRKERYPLRLDDKCLTAWNSLMIAALCLLYQVCGDRVYLDAAKRADIFLRENLYDDRTLFVSFRKGKRGVRGFLDDYAAFVYAQLALYSATLEQEYLSRAQELCREILTRFQDTENGGFYLYDADHEALILRPKESFDGAMPSGNSLMAWNLVRLSQLVPDPLYKQQAARQLAFLAAEAASYPTGYAMFLLAQLNREDPPPSVTVVLSEGADASRLPLTIPCDAAVTVLRTPDPSHPLRNGQTTLYVCRGHSCLPPVNDWSELISFGDR